MLSSICSFDEMNHAQTVDQLVCPDIERYASAFKRDSLTAAEVFGANVRAFREKRAMSRCQLAKCIELSADHVAAIEAGQPGRADFDIVVRIKTCLNSSYRDLVGGIG